MTTNALIGHGATFQLLDETLSPPAYVTVAEVTNISSPFAISRDSVEVTHTESTDGIREFIPGLVDYGDASIELNWVPKSTTDKRIRDLFRTKALSSAKIVFPTSPASTLTFDCFATAYSPGAPLDDKLTASATFKISGRPVFTGEV